MKVLLSFLLLIISSGSYSQTKYIMVDRGFERKAIRTDSLDLSVIKKGYFPINADQLDSLYSILKVFDNTATLKLNISNVQRAYGDLYNIKLLSLVAGWEYNLMISDAANSAHTNSVYISRFIKYLKNTIKETNKLK